MCRTRQLAVSSVGPSARPSQMPRFRFQPGRLTRAPCRRLGQVLTAIATGLACIGAATGDASAGPKSEPKTVGHVKVQALADRDGIVPGAAFYLAVSLEIDEGWYVYWQSPGAADGPPTRVEWALPPGFKVGRTRYPVPEVKQDKRFKGDFYVLQGKAVLMTPVQTPDNLDEKAAPTFTAKVNWVVCQEADVPGRAEVSLSLPVLQAGKEATAANEKVFEDARESLPIPTGKAQHLKLSSGIDKEQVEPGDRFGVTLTAMIQAKHHMQSHKPLQEGLIPAIVFVERTKGLEIDEVAYPKAQERADKVLGKMSEYSGNTVFKIPVTAAADADKRPRWIRGILQSQICTDAGTCYQPQYIEFAIPVQMAGGEKPSDEDAIAAAVAAPKKPSEAESPDKAEEGVVEGKEEPKEKPETQVKETKAETSAPTEVPTPQVVRQDTNILIRFQTRLLDLGFFGAILLALFGGFLMNLMPCVLPVISLKVLSFVRQAHEDRRRVFRLGLTYAAGIMVFYLVFAGLMYFGGVGWGELFQNSVFVLVMAAVVLAMALSLFGVFAILTPRVVNELGQKAESQEGYLSAFGTGLLATLLGTACTAPLLSVAIAYASRLPPAQGGMIFIAAGIGMALPFIVLTYNPAWLRFVPKPGPWMLTFEQVMGFLLLATVIWLIYPLRGQLGDYGLYLSLIFLLCVAVAAWLKGKIEFGAPAARKAKLYGAILVFLLIGWLLPFRWMATISELRMEKAASDELVALGERAKHGRQLDWSKGIPWQHYSRDLALRDVADGYTVFVDYTADWCASCKANKKTSLEVEQTVKVMRDLGVIPYEADYTSKKPQITEDLKRFGRAGVPMYLVYKPGDARTPEVLPELLTPGIVIEALKRAGPSKPEPAASP